VNTVERDATGEGEIESRNNEVDEGVDDDNNGSVSLECEYPGYCDSKRNGYLARIKGTEGRTGPKSARKRGIRYLTTNTV